MYGSCVTQMRWSSTASLRATATMARVRDCLPPRSAGCKPHRRRLVFSSRTQDVVAALDQQGSQINVTGLGDAELRIAVPGLAASRPEAEIAAHVATSPEAMRCNTDLGEFNSSERGFARAANMSNPQRLRRHEHWGTNCNEREISTRCLILPRCVVLKFPESHSLSNHAHLFVV